MRTGLRDHFPQWLLLATLLLLPFGVGAELAVLAGAIAGVVRVLRGRVDWSKPLVRLALLLGVGYWLPQFASAWDSIAASKSWMEVALDLRFVPFLLYLADAPCTPAGARLLKGGIAALVLLWCVDALVQAVFGHGLGGAFHGDRLSGIFGDGNLKLGGVLAVLAPFAMVESWQRRGGWGLAVATVLLLLIILLAGARAAWFGFAFGAALVFWQLLGTRRALYALLALSVTVMAVGTGAYVGSERFAERVDRTAAALAGDRAALDHALSGRLEVWETAGRMAVAHPVNGVGVRAFRYAYADHAAEDDPFVAEGGALHAHQIVLELWSETGIIGVLVWLLVAAGAWRVGIGRPTPAKARAMPAAIALVVALFPLNTHYAVYSAFWGLLLMWLLAVWLQLLQDGSDQS